MRWKNHDKIVGLKAEIYTYLIDDGSEDWKRKFQNYKNCLEIT